MGELKPNRKLFPDYLSFILHGVLVGAGSLWLGTLRKLFSLGLVWGREFRVVWLLIMHSFFCHVFWEMGHRGRWKGLTNAI